MWVFFTAEPLILGRILLSSFLETEPHGLMMILGSAAIMILCVAYYGVFFFPTLLWKNSERGAMAWGIVCLIVHSVLSVGTWVVAGALSAHGH